MEITKSWRQELSNLIFSQNSYFNGQIDMYGSNRARAFIFCGRHAIQRSASAWYMLEHDVDACVPPYSSAHPQAARALSEPKLLHFNRHIHFHSSNYTSMHAQCKYDVNSNLDGPSCQRYKHTCAECTCLLILQYMHRVHVALQHHLQWLPPPKLHVLSSPFVESPTHTQWTDVNQRIELRSSVGTADAENVENAEYGKATCVSVCP